MRTTVALNFLLTLFLSVKIYALTPVSSLKVSSKYLSRDFNSSTGYISEITNFITKNEFLKEVLKESGKSSDFDIYLNLYKIPENPFKIYSLIIINKNSLSLDYTTLYKDNPKFSISGDYYIFGDAEAAVKFNETDLIAKIPDYSSTEVVLYVPVEVVYNYFSPLMPIYKGMINLSFAEKPHMQKNMSMLFEMIIDTISKIKDIVITKDNENFSAILNFKDEATFPNVFPESEESDELLYNSLKSAYTANGFAININELKEILTSYYKGFVKLKLLNNKALGILEAKTEKLFFNGKVDYLFSETIVNKKEAKIFAQMGFSWIGDILNRDLISDWLSSSFQDTPFNITLSEKTENLKINLSLKDVKTYTSYLPPFIFYSINSLFKETDSMSFDLFLNDNNIKCSINENSEEIEIKRHSMQFIYLTKDAFKSLLNLNNDALSASYEMFFKNDLFFVLKRNGQKLTFQLRVN